MIDVAWTVERKPTMNGPGYMLRYEGRPIGVSLNLTTVIKFQTYVTGQCTCGFCN